MIEYEIKALLFNKKTIDINKMDINKIFVCSDIVFCIFYFFIEISRNLILKISFCDNIRAS